VPLRLHVDDPDLPRAAITFTARATAFSARLVEKDYCCSVVLEHLAASRAGLIFKGGTCLSKIHGDLYRLSEDLDFSVSTPVDAPRAARSRLILPVKTALAALPDALAGFRIVEPFRGANSSTQYNATVGYESRLDGHAEPVNIEVGVREPTILDPHGGTAKTALLNPIDGRPLVEPFPVACLSYQEAMAEKVRAALCRRDVAMRLLRRRSRRPRRVRPARPSLRRAGEAQAGGSANRPGGRLGGSCRTAHTAARHAAAPCPPRPGVRPVRPEACRRDPPSGRARADPPMITDINSEDRLVQQTFADHLRNRLGLGEPLRLQRRDLRVRGNTGPRVGAGRGARP
jgi:hypothetical protein